MKSSSLRSVCADLTALMLKPVILSLPSGATIRVLGEIPLWTMPALCSVPRVESTGIRSGRARSHEIQPEELFLKRCSRRVIPSIFSVIA